MYLNLKTYILILMGILVPICSVLSPLFPFLIKGGFIFFWMIFFPLAVFSIKNIQGLSFMLLTTLVLLFQLYGLQMDYFQKYFNIFISLFTMLYVFASHPRMDLDSINKIAIGLGFGALFINIITIIAMYLISTGLIDLTQLRLIFNTPDDIGLFRFALGNPIHVPFLITICTILGVKFLKSNWLIFFLISMNLITVVISQSRGIFLITLFHLLFLFSKSGLSSRIIFSSISIFFFIYFYEIFSGVSNSLVARLAGEDLGSAETRTQYFALIYENFDLVKLFFGGGLLSSQLLISETLGEVQTVEASIIEMVYELGIIATILFLLPLFLKMINIGLVKNIPIYFYIILGQIFFLLPVTTTFGLIFTLIIFMLNIYENDRNSRVTSVGLLRKY